MEEILHQEVDSLSHDLQGFSTIPGGAGFLPSTVSLVSFYDMRLVVVLRPHPARLQVWKRRCPRTRVPRPRKLRRQGACWVGILTQTQETQLGRVFDGCSWEDISDIKHEMNN